MRATKDSGVDWLGEIPADWEVRPSWSSFRRVKQIGFPEEELLSVYRDHGVVPKSSRDDNHNVESEDLTSYQLVRVGDMVMNKMKAWQGSIALSDHRGIVSPAYFVYRPTQEFNRKYFHYLLRSAPYVAHYNRISKGVRVGQWDLDPTYFRTTSLIVPPIEEQRRIADFLDRETARIDALIAKQEQLITTLDERRQALISQVIMRGLGKNSPVSTASIDHYEATPSSWSWVRLKDVAEVTPSNVDKKAYEGGIPVSLCNYVDVYYNELISADLNFMTATATPEEIRKFELKKGWVIITKDSEDASDIGIAAYVPEDLPNVVCGYHLSIVRPKDGVSGLFLKWFFDSTMTKGFMAKRSNGLTRMALGQGAISTLPICLPPFAEQVEIANYLLETTKKIDELIRNSREVVGLLRERRQALISAAVTGQLEVGV